MPEHSLEVKCSICDEKKDLKLCGGCKLVIFCSVDCQRADWPSHRDFCKKVSKVAENDTTPFLCYNCEKTTHIGDFTCQCLKTFCSDACRYAAPHTYEECAESSLLISRRTEELMKTCRSMSKTEKINRRDELSFRFYVSARFLEKTQGVFANKMMMNAARAGNGYAIMRIARFSIDEIREIYKS